MRFDEVRMEGPLYLEYRPTLPTWSINHRRRLVMIDDADTGYAIYFGSQNGWRRLDFTFSGVRGDEFIENIFTNISGDTTYEEFAENIYNEDGTLNLSGTDVFVAFDGENYFLTSSLPDQTNYTNGEVLQTDGTRAYWYKLTAKDILPDQTGQQGRFLRTNGNGIRWSSVPSDLPPQGGHSGKVLSTNGSLPSWRTVQEALGLPGKSGHGGEFLKVNENEESLQWDRVIPENTTSIVKHLANDGNDTYWSDNIVPEPGNRKSALITRGDGNIEWSIYDVLPNQEYNDGNILATNGVFPFWTDIDVDTSKTMSEIEDVDSNLTPVNNDILQYDEYQQLWVSTEFTGNYVKTDGDSEPTTDNQWVIGTNEKRFKKIYSVCFIGTSSQTRLADLAEIYSCYTNPIVGTVMLISEDENIDCEESNIVSSHRVLGIVSENPGYLMNKDDDGVIVGLKGRLPCWVQGPIKKGTPLVSFRNGTAIGVNQLENIPNGSILAKSNESIENNEVRFIEVIK